MLTLRPSGERGHADHGWLQSQHSFSFASYHDPRHMGWGNLRVINEDHVAPGQGFGTHGHRDMEIVSYVLSGQLAHRDSLGNVEVIPAGEVQRMSAGTGVMHSEFNPSPDTPVHFLQIWLLPRTPGIAPDYQQATVPAGARRGRLLCIAAPPGEGGLVDVHADARLHAGLFDGPTEQAQLPIAPGRKAYVRLVRGRLQANGMALAAGDALLLQDEAQVLLEGGEDAEVLVFDLAP